MKRPKAPEPTAQELAGVARQSRMIDEETKEMEKRLKATARGKSGSTSLLAKAGKASSGKSGKASSGTSGVSGKSMMSSGYKGTPYKGGGRGGSSASRQR